MGGHNFPHSVLASKRLSHRDLGLNPVQDYTMLDSKGLSMALNLSTRLMLMRMKVSKLLSKVSLTPFVTLLVMLLVTML